MRAISLRTKVFFLFAGAALLIVVPALLLIADAVKKGVYERANEELEHAGSSLADAWVLRDDNLMTAARLRALDTLLVRAWEGGDPRRMSTVLRRGLEKNLALAVDSSGTWLIGRRFGPEVIRSIGASGTIVALPEEGGPPVRFALSPVRNDSALLGWVGLGTELSAAGLKKEYARGTEVVLQVGDSVVGSTLPDSVHGPVLRSLGSSGVAGHDILEVGERAYMAAAYSVPTQGLPTTAILLRPIADELQVSRAIEQSLIGIGLAALVLALLLAWFVARIVARPAQALAEASARMARGDFAAPLPRAASDEIGQLARAFGDMRSAIADREARLRSAQAEMIHREKLAAMGRLVAQLSHEINNPIYNIQNCLEALERRGDPGDPNREFLELAQEELTRMAALTRRLLEQSRPQSDASRPLSLNEVAERVLTLAGPELRARGVVVEAELAPDLPAVVAHPEAIHQVLANLVDNAVDAMPSGGCLRVATRADRDTVEVMVEDTGAGISAEDLPHIFEAFYSTKPGVNGTGLGLFVSEGIIRGHRGRIDVESAPGRGSRFTVRLPQQTLDESVSVGSAPERDAAPAAL